MMTSATPTPAWPAAAPMNATPALPPDYIQQQQMAAAAAAAAATSGHRVIHRGGVVGAPAPLPVNPMGVGLPPDAAVVPAPGGGMAVVPNMRGGGGMVGPGGPVVGGYPANGPTMLPSTFAVGNGDDGSDNLVLHRGGSGGVYAAGGGGGQLAGVGSGATGGRWGRSPAMAVLQG